MSVAAIDRAPASQPFVSHDDPCGQDCEHRLLIFADRFGPSQQISFLEGLKGGRSAGRIAVRVIGENDLQALVEERSGDALDDFLAATFAEVDPTALIFSRFADHRFYDRILLAHPGRAATLLHLDDDFFSIPPFVGIDRYRSARNPRRIHTLGRIGRTADLILASTPILAGRLARMFGPARVGFCDICAGGPPFTPPERSGPVRIGYFGSATHDRDLAMIADALREVKAALPVEIEIVGSVAKGRAARSLRDVATLDLSIEHDYAAFRAGLRQRGWDIGAAPLIAHPFNAAKTPIKWNEYAQAGIAVLASRTEPYLDLGRRGALSLASPREWNGKLAELVRHPQRRRMLVAEANRLLAATGWERMESILIGLLERAAHCRRAAAL